MTRRWSAMTAIVVTMVLIVVVALVVLAVFSPDEADADRTVSRTGRPDPGDGHLDDLLE